MEKLEEENLDYENNDIETVKQIQNNQQNLINGILFCLLYLDGLIMIDIENINKIQSIALFHQIDLFGILKYIMKNNILDLNLKEIASHLFCTIIGFCEYESNYDEIYKFIFTLTNEHYILTYIINYIYYIFTYIYLFFI